MKPVPIILPRAKARRVRGSGRIFQKGNSRTWTIQYYVEGFKKKKGQPVLDGDGRPVRARVAVREATGFTSQRKAQELLTQRLGEVSRGEWFDRERRPATVEELFEAMRDHYEVNRSRSAESLGRRWTHLKVAFASTVASNLTTDAVTRYARQRQGEGAANATVNRELSTLGRALNLARRCTPPKVRTVPYIPMLAEDNVRRGFVEDADFKRLAFAAEEGEHWLRVFLEIGFTYGWRKGELLALRVRQVNLPNRTIRLDAGTTKNGDGREVAMTARVAELLRHAVAGKAPDDFVLTREIKAGKRTVQRPVRSVRAAWRNLCVRAGLGKFVCCACERPATKR